jgi:flavin reductase (DIM6/NTAB) family NADH-FMN oxidoreductase RutF
MHYDPKLKDHGLPHDPFAALVVPRPIGWISTLDRGGRVNLAPYSFFNAVSGRPPFVMFASNNRKDSQRNAEESGEFVVNLATYELCEEMNATSAPVPPGVDEAALAGLAMAPSQRVKPPRVARARAALECVTTASVPIVGKDGTAHPTTIVVGEVVHVFIDEELLVDGRVDFGRMQPLSRLGYLDYGLIGRVFSMTRPAAEELINGSALSATEMAQGE